MYKLSLLFSNPELGQVQPNEGDEPTFMIFIAGLLCAYVLIVVVSTIIERLNERRRRG